MVSDGPLNESTEIVVGIGWLKDQVGEVGSVSEDESEVFVVRMNP
jgi:hypothetical protein